MGSCCGRNRPPAARRYDKATGSSGSAEQSFSLIFRDGRTEHYGSRLEADAANARSGYIGVVRQNSRR